MYKADFLCGWQVWDFYGPHLGEIEKWHEHQGYILYFEYAEYGVRYFKSNVTPLLILLDIW